MDMLELLLETEKAIEPFYAFVEGNAAKALRDDMALTQGSPMARRQVTVGDFRRLAALRPKLAATRVAEEARDQSFINQARKR